MPGTEFGQEFEKTTYQAVYGWNRNVRKNWSRPNGQKMLAICNYRGERERERDTFYFYAQRPKRFMQKPLHERSYEDMSQTMGIDMVNFLKQYRDLMVKVKGVVVVVVRSHFRLYIVTSYEFTGNICRMSWIQGLPKGLEYALNLSRHRLWKAEPVLEKQFFIFFQCFLISSDEIIISQIDDVAKTKNCQKGPRAAGDRIHPWSGAFQFCVNVLKHLFGMVQPGLETFRWIQLWSQDPRSRATVQKPSFSEGNPFRTLKTNRGQQTADHEVPLLPMLGWMDVDLQINSRCLTCYKTM